MIAEHVRFFARIPELNEHLHGTIILCISWGFSILIYLVFISFVTGTGGWDFCRLPWDARWFQSITCRSTPRGSVSLSACGWEATREKSLRLIRLSPEIGAPLYCRLHGEMKISAIGILGHPNFGTDSAYCHFSGQHMVRESQVFQFWHACFPQTSFVRWRWKSDSWNTEGLGDKETEEELSELVCSKWGPSRWWGHHGWRDGSTVSLILEIGPTVRSQGKEGKIHRFFPFFGPKFSAWNLWRVNLVSPWRKESPFRFVYARIDRPAGTIKFGPLAEQNMGDWTNVPFWGMVDISMSCSPRWISEYQYAFCSAIITNLCNYHSFGASCAQSTVQLT